VLVQRRIDTDDLKNELPVVKSFILNKHMAKPRELPDNVAVTVMRVQQIQEFLHQYREAFPQTYKLYCTAVTFGASSATCENSFSTLTRILTPATVPDVQFGAAVIRETTHLQSVLQR
jgi:hypothetical protein